MGGGGEGEEGEEGGREKVRQKEDKGGGRWGKVMATRAGQPVLV